MIIIRHYEPIKTGSIIKISGPSVKKIRESLLGKPSDVIIVIDNHGHCFRPNRYHYKSCDESIKFNGFQKSEDGFIKTYSVD